MPPPPPQPEPTDQDLIAAANGGDADAFARLYERYRDWVASLAFRFTADRELALDVMQETFVYFLGKFPGFRLRARLKTFLYPVVRHTALAAVSRSRRLVMEQGGPTFDVADREPPEDLRGLARVLDALPAGQREVLILRFHDDLALKEIATALGIPLGTVKSRLHLALQTLRADPRTAEYAESIGV